MQNFGEHLVTRDRLATALADAGLRRGDIVCVHTALSRLGYVCGGARTVIEAFQEALGPSGTLMMPTYTRDTADPREWRYPPAPASWLDELVSATPPYDPDRTPTQSVGAVAELFRTYPNVRRSNHPISSVAAYGPKAELLITDVPLDNRFGEDSPYGRLVGVGGKVVMLGAPYETMSLLHLSQYRIGWGKKVIKSARMTVDGRPQWVQFNDLELPHAWATDCVAAMVAAGVAIRNNFAASYILIVDASAAVQFSLDWRKQHSG